MASLREYRALHMRGTPGGMGAGLSPNALVLPERLRSMPLLTLGEAGLAACTCACVHSGTDEPHSITTVPSPLGLCFPASFTSRVHTALLNPSALLCVPPGLIKTAALRGTGRDVNSDERTAVGGWLAWVGLHPATAARGCLCPCMLWVAR